MHQINQNSSKSTPPTSNTSNIITTSVQANIAQSAHQAVKQYPINATLIKTDNPNFSQPHIERPLQVFDHSIIPSDTIDPDHHRWALSQLQIANHFINRQIRENEYRPLTFKEPPYPLPIGHSTHQQAHESYLETSAQFHAGLLQLPLVRSVPHSARTDDPPSTPSLREFYKTVMVTTTSFEGSPPSEPTTIRTSTLPDASSPLTKQSSSVPNSPRPDPFETPQPGVRFKLKSESPDPLALPTSRSSSTMIKSRHEIPSDVNSTPQLKRRKMDKFNAYVATSSHTQPARQKHLVNSSPKADDNDLGIMRKSTSIPSSATRNLNSPSLPNPAARLASVVEDILEADDMRDGTNSACDFLIVTDTDPILNPKALSKMTKLIEHDHGNCLLDISGDDMSRLMKILEKGVKVFEEIVVFPSELKSPKTPLPCSSKSSSKSKRPIASNSNSKSCIPGSSPGPSDLNGAPLDQEHESFHRALPSDSVAENHIKIIQERTNDMLNALQSVNFILLLLSCEKKLPKRFYSEETISMITQSLNHQLHTVIFPFMQTGQRSAVDAYSSRLEYVLSKSNATRQTVSSIFSVVSTSVLPKISLLVTNLELPESILNRLTHLCISSFLFEPHAACFASTRARSSGQSTIQSPYSHGGIAVMRLECLNLLRNISSKYPAQTDGIVDEVLSSIVNVSSSFVSSPIVGSGSARYQYVHPSYTSKPARLSHGKSIHSISALLLHIIQCSAHGTRARLRSKLRNLHDRRDEKKVMGASPTDDSEVDIYRVVKETVEPVFSTATQLGTKIIRFLSERSTKNSKSNNESIYRVVFDRLVSDSIDLLYLPDWPVAEFVLGLFCKKMVDIWEESKTTSADRNTIKILFIDHMGHIAARLFRPYPAGETDGKGELTPSAQAPNLFKTMLKTGDIANLSQFFQSQAHLILHLDGLNNMEDEANSASDFLHAQWSMEFMKAIRSLRPDQQMDEVPTSSNMLDFLKQQLQIFCSLETQLAPNSAISRRVNPDPAYANPGSILESVSQIQGLKLVRDLLLDRIILASATSVVTFRSKAIKALGLVVAQDETIFYRSECHCIKTIYAIASVSPRMLSPNKAMILLPYLKGANRAEEQMTIQYLLKLFKACVTDTPKLSNHFCDALQAALLPALNKPNLGDGVMILQERVSCFCAVVIHQTHDFLKLIKVFKACEQRLRDMLTAHGQLDELAVKNEDIRNETKTVGVVIFTDPSIELRSRLLKLVAEFLASLAPITNTIDMEQLIGNTDNFADSGVGLAIVQRYLPQITSFAQSVDGPMQKAAVDIIAYTIKQGLAHPMSCIPVLVALESSSDQILAKRVFGLHTLLHTKRPDLVHTRFLEVMREVYEFYSRTNSSVSGYFGTPARSVIAPWYTLLSQKRTWRLDLIKSLVKSFSVDPLSSTVEIDNQTIDFNRFLCEAILTIDFKTQEEVLTLVNALNSILGQYAYQALDVLEGSMTMKMLDDEDEDNLENDIFEDIGSKTVAVRASVVLGMVFRLRDRVKLLYGLTDQKCLKFLASGGKKSKMGDTAAVRRLKIMEEDKENFENGLSSSFVNGKLESKEDMLKQVKMFEQLIRDDVILGQNAADEDEDEVMMEE
ncbi:sister chromatid cohesion C-terminus-domain-containing protein [Melampsora americana]|nr:sister chromatid cohesion C-terminus-domain-containing protein [Melampsora americana]